MDPNIGILPEHTKEVALILNTLLADETLLYTKTRNYHWNIEGSNFIQIHEFYEDQYNELAELIDEIAERVRQIGHFAEGRLKDFIALTNLEEQGYTDDQKIQLKNLLADHETIARTIREHVPTVEEEYKDLGTADFLTSTLQLHEKMAWMIRAHIR